MKKLLRIAMVVAAGLIGLCGTTATQAQGTVSFQVFYDQLQPYGTWMNYGNYGYVWIPQADRDFVPYGTNGYWVNTEYGNTWVSDYDWGWAPFHYGRWLYDDFYGWMWVPGNEWAPAWVAWRSGGGYYGWAPLMPGMGIDVSFSVYNRIPNHCWNFVPYQYVTYRRVYAHCVPRPTVVNIIHQTTFVTYNRHDNHHAYFTGPSRREMEHDGRTRVPQYRVDSRNTPGRPEVDRGAVAMYRPQVEGNTRHAAAPTRVVQESDMRRRQETVLSQRNRPDSYHDERQRDAEHRPAIQQDQRRETQRTEAPRRDADEFRRQQQENDVREQQDVQQRERIQEQQRDQQDRLRQQQLQDRQQQNNIREQQDRQQQRIQEQQRNEQQERPDSYRDQRQLQDRRQQENSVREQHQQQERILEQQRSQQQDRMRQQQQMQDRRQQENNMREQQNQRLQQQQQQIREQQQQQNRQRMEQRQVQEQQRRPAPSPSFQRERAPSQPNNGGGGGSQRRRH
jgi:DNA segregation ATPase FtsK/SpoIIIE-like protein